VGGPTVEEFLTMSEEQRAGLPKARQKKLAKLAEVLRRKQAKEAAVSAEGSETSGVPSKRSQAKAQREKSAHAAMAPIDFVNTTPKGEFKDMTQPMVNAYHPKSVEAAWYEYWEAKGYFSVDVDSSRTHAGDQQFVMVIPPPNVTGSLHLGHTLMIAIQDTLTRWHRMSGRTALWLPGVDHAGIGTQSVVEKDIWKREKRTRHDLGREEFINRVWAWKDEFGGRICNQVRRLGASVDWKREEFTMSDKLSRAVREAFVRLYDEGLIYRETRLVNWSCKLRSAISDIEVDYIDIQKRTMRKVPQHDTEVEFGVLTKFAYKVLDVTDDQELVVATTRLETMLGDVAVAVHPDDPRYKHLIGKKLKHPFVEREMEVIADGILVDMAFGTGAVKITPAHDPNDRECGRRHQLPDINVIDEDGSMSKNCGQFSGMMRYVARVEVERALDSLGLLRGKQENPMRLAICSKSDDVIEPLLRPQWYVRCGDMGKAAAEVVRNGELKIFPEDFKDTWYYWTENLRDWCISRQLWWGHRIPAYRAVHRQSGEASWVVGRTDEEAMARACREWNTFPENISLEQDDDVLDTWFSSGLFPFSTFGWPDEEHPDFRNFYPNSILETGHDIIFFWVARMVILGMKLTGKLPFHTVYLHAMVRDKTGRKMSKSLGNVIDPLEIIQGCSLDNLLDKLSQGNLDPTEIQKAGDSHKADFPEGIPECGADALRYGLLAYTLQERDMNLDVSRVVAYRNFCNKLWNATRFALLNLGPDFSFSVDYFRSQLHAARTIDRWIISQLNETCKGVDCNLKEFRFADTVGLTHNFWLHDLCDVYLEASKPIMRDGDHDSMMIAKHCLYYCLHVGLRLLHPMMPFVTEELFQRLPNRRSHDPVESICISPFPTWESRFVDDEACQRVERLMRITRCVRSTRASYKLPPRATPKVYILCRTEATLEHVEDMTPEIATLANLSLAKPLSISAKDEVPPGSAASVVDDDIEVHVSLQGMVDIPSELAKLRSSVAEREILLANYVRQTQVPDYETKVPAQVRQKTGDQILRVSQEMEVLQELVERFQGLLLSSGLDRGLENALPDPS